MFVQLFNQSLQVKHENKVSSFKNKCVSFTHEIEEILPGKKNQCFKLTLGKFLPKCDIFSLRPI